MSCEQTKGLSVLEHGQMVNSYLFDLVDHLKYGKNLKFNWKLPTWVYEYKQEILDDLPDNRTLELYTIYHDCGKPFCLETDELGRRHFPNHAEVSYRIFSDVFNNSIAPNLILHDMDIHLLKSDGVDDFCKVNNHLTLLITGLSEIHANSEIFGGIESTSFKIKHKSISKNGLRILKNKKQNEKK